MSEDELELNIHRELPGMDWNNDDLFFTHEWVDETSQFDTHPSVRWTGECYDRTYRARVPKAFENCDELIDKFITMMVDDYPDVADFWRS